MSTKEVDTVATLLITVSELAAKQMYGVLAKMIDKMTKNSG